MFSTFYSSLKSAGEGSSTAGKCTRGSFASRHGALALAVALALGSLNAFADDTAPAAAPQAAPDASQTTPDAAKTTAATDAAPAAPDAQLAADAQPVKMTDEQLMAKGVDELNKKNYEEASPRFSRSIWMARATTTRPRSKRR